VQEISEDAYRQTDKPAILWMRGYYGATLAFRRTHGADMLVLKMFRFQGRVMVRSLNATQNRYFTLTDADVESMIVPRLI
jgi:hypothetical protein